MPRTRGTPRRRQPRPLNRWPLANPPALAVLTGGQANLRSFQGVCGVPQIYTGLSNLLYRRSTAIGMWAQRGNRPITSTQRNQLLSRHLNPLTVTQGWPALAQVALWASQSFDSHTRLASVGAAQSVVVQAGLPAGDGPAGIVSPTSPPNKARGSWARRPGCQCQAGPSCWAGQPARKHTPPRD
jgi:hypothetical protein